MSFTNAGTINVSSGDTVNVTATSFNNAGTINVTDATVDINSTGFADSGDFILSSGKLEITAPVGVIGGIRHNKWERHVGP